MARFRLGRRREDRLGQLLGSRAARAAADAADRAALAILLPAGAGQVAAHDALDRHHLRLARPASCGRAACSACAANAGPMSATSMLSRWFGTSRKSNQNSVMPVRMRPLSGMPRRQHPVEGADAVGGDDDQAVAQVVDVADLAAAARILGNVALEQRRGHERPLRNV